MATKVQVEQKWLNTASACKYLGISYAALYRYVKAGKLPSHRLGKLILFDKEEIDNFIKGKKK